MTLLTRSVEVLLRSSVLGNKQGHSLWRSRLIFPAIEVSMGAYLGKPAGTPGVAGLDMEPPAGLDIEPPAGLDMEPPAGLEVESPAGLAVPLGVPVGMVIPAGTFTPEAGLFLGLGVVGSGAVVAGAVVVGTLVGVVELSDAPVAGVVGLADPGFFMLPVVAGFLVFLVLGFV